MPNLILQQILKGQTQPVQPLGGHTGRSPAKNPFMRFTGLAENHQSDIGVNQPLLHPMFVGYVDRTDPRGNSKRIPVYAGSRLCVLY